jgi:type I restriction enzyme R subunit
MSYQSEAELEQQLLNLMKTKFDYEFIKIKDVSVLESNFRTQLNYLNRVNLAGSDLTDKEFERVMIYINGKSIFQSAKQLRDKFQLQRDNGDVIYLQLIDFDTPSNNKYQISNQITLRGKYENRYDVTLLINGLPIVQCELKRRGLHIKEAFNQMCRYARHSYDGLFRYIQILIISNGVDTKYFANGDKPYQYPFTFYWTDEQNNRITNLFDFSNAFLNHKNLIEMLNTYTVLNDTDKIMLIMRPYQVYAVRALVKQALETGNGGYIWHTTGSGKTLTSFKAAQILSAKESIKKVIFVIDRHDLDTQTLEEFNKFEKDSVDTTDNTFTLVKQFKDKGNRLIVTTVQKLNHAIRKVKYASIMERYSEEKMIIIMDECHRSQFGDMHTRIKKFFHKAQFFGFTGTPRFIENKSQDGRTTADIFGRCLHTYMIKEAIYDNNVLGFSVEYVKTFKGQYDENNNEKVKAIDTKEVFEEPYRISLVASHIINHHNNKTMSRKYTAIFATPGIPMLLKYYEEFKTIKHDLNIAAIFSYQANENLDGKAEHSRESLDKIIADYNKTFGTSFSTDTFSSYHADVTKRVKKAEIDILIVVNMFLTGFDSKPLNTLYVDKNLQYHDLLQAYSRTNRIYEATKKWGNVVCYRNLKIATDEALRRFSNGDGMDVILQKDFQTYLKEFKKALYAMLAIAPTPQDVDSLFKESDQEKFVLAFKALAQLLLALRTFIDFEFTEELLGIDEQTYEDYKSKYLNLYEKYKKTNNGDEKASIISDIDFEIELVQTDRINVEYILNLLRNMSRENESSREKDIRHILTELGRTDNEQLKKKVDLIKAFLEHELQHVSPEHDVDEAYLEYENKERAKEIEKFANESEIDIDFLKNEISEYEFTGLFDRERINNQIQKPFLIKKKIVTQIIDFIKENVLKYQ